MLTFWHFLTPVKFDRYFQRVATFGSRYFGNFTVFEFIVSYFSIVLTSCKLHVPLDTWSDLYGHLQSV